MPSKQSANEEAAREVGPELAFERTRLAYERTMMGWIRTATSLIAFGFTVYKFFQFELVREGPAPGAQIVSPRGFALFMIGSGLIALLMASLQHRQSLQALRARGVEAPRSIAALLGGLISLLGIIAFLAAVLRQ